MSSFDLYGFRNHDMALARGILESVLNIKLLERESDYQGGLYYLSGDSSGEHYLLKRNIDLADNEPAEPTFHKYSIIFYVNDTQQSDILKSRINEKAPDFILLRSEQFD